jgi:MOSC domain-containing protein YiiM
MAMQDSPFLTTAALEAGLEHILQSPRQDGAIRMIVRRPRIDEREVLDEGTLDLIEGLTGDNWKPRGNHRTPDGSADPDRQLTVMNCRVAALVAQQKERWPLAGDQIFVDLDLSFDNLPEGSRLKVGSATIVVTPPPHNGCKKFTERFGVDATAFISTPLGKQLRMRGLNAKVVEPGVIRVGDIAKIV